MIRIFLVFILPPSWKNIFHFLLYTTENTLGSSVLHSRQTIPLKYREECLTDHSSISFQLVDFTRIALTALHIGEIQ
jgi:hypothetical protein